MTTLLQKTIVPTLSALLCSVVFIPQLCLAQQANTFENGVSSNLSWKFLDAARSFDRYYEESNICQNIDSVPTFQCVDARLESAINLINSGKLDEGTTRINIARMISSQTSDYPNAKSGQIVGLDYGSLYARSFQYEAARGLNTDEPTVKIVELAKKSREIRQQIRDNKRSFSGGQIGENQTQLISGDDNKIILTAAVASTISPAFEVGPLAQSQSQAFADYGRFKSTKGQQLAIQDAQSYLLEALAWTREGQDRFALTALNQASLSLENPKSIGNQSDPAVSLANAPILWTMIETEKALRKSALANGNVTQQRNIADAYERNVLNEMFSESDKTSRLRGLSLFRLAEMRIQSGDFVGCVNSDSLCGFSAFEQGAEIIRSSLSNPTIDFVWTEPFLDAVYNNQSAIDDWENRFYGILQIASRSEVASEAAEAVIRLKENDDTELGQTLKAIDLAEFAFRNADRELEIMRAKQAAGEAVPADVFTTKQDEVAALSINLDTIETNFKNSDSGKRFAQLVSSSVSLERIQNSLDGDEAYARIVLGKDVGYLVLITKQSQNDNGVSITKIDRSRNAVQKAVETLRCAVDFQNIEKRFACAKLNDGNKDFISEFPVYDVKVAANLFDDIFGPIKTQIMNGNIKHLIVQPDSVLAPLPFSALVTTDPAMISNTSITHIQNGRRWNHDYSGVGWLADSVSISHSVGELSFVQARDASRDVNRVRAPKPFLGFSGFKNYDAETAQRVAAANGVDPTTCSRFYQGFADLSQETNLHTSIIQSAIGGDIVKDGEFTDTNIVQFSNASGQSQLKDYRVVLFATHGISPSPLAHGCLPEPGLTTNISLTTPGSDGFLSASDIASDLKLGADLVILSACETAVGSAVSTFSDRPTAETFDGLVRAFYFAQAQSLLVTHWTLPASQTTTVFESLFNNPSSLSEEAFAERLRQTQVSIRNGSFEGNSTSHPYFWANFVFVGDGRLKLDL